MKTLIFIDNGREKEAEENKRTSQRRLKFYGDVSNEHLSNIEVIANLFRLDKGKVEDLLFSNENAIITYSMFTENHFNSYDQLNDFMVYAGMSDFSHKVYINTSTYLKDTLERIIKNEGQSIYVCRAIENNFIIHYDDNAEKFYRLRFDLHSEDFIKLEDVNIASLIE